MGQKNHAKDSRQEGFRIGGHNRKEAGGGEGDRTGGTSGDRISQASGRQTGPGDKE